MHREGECTRPVQTSVMADGLMAESREHAAAAAEVSRACAEYLLRTSAHAARTAHLFEQVVGCVGRGQLAPAALGEALAAFVEDRGARDATAAAETTARF